MSIPMYKSVMDKALPGLLFGTNEHVVLTRIASEDIAFGKPLYGDTDGEKVVGKNTEGDKTFLGIAGSTQCVDGLYKAGMPVNCVNKGMIYVKVVQAVKANGKVFAVKTNGDFRADADTSNAVEVPGAMYLEDGQPNEIVGVLLK